jgi:hypothetical protein
MSKGVARARYTALSTSRQQFLDRAYEASQLTLPYLIRRDTTPQAHKNLRTPWQAVGAKAVSTLASKLMLALLPPQTTFFKLQVRDDKLGMEMDANVRTDLDLAFSKIERMVMDYIAASSDRVVVHEAIRHLIVGGNGLLYLDNKDGLKFYPINRYVINRDGNGNVLEIVTKELISNYLLNQKYPGILEQKPNQVMNDSTGQGDDVDVYTYVRLDKKSGRWLWHQEVYDQILPGTQSTAPKTKSPWMPLRFNSVDGEMYGRGRVEEYMGDLKSLEALSQALVEGSAAAAKVVFLVSPSSTTKPAQIAQAGNGAIVQGRPDDVSVIQVGKTADFRTAMEMAMNLEKRIGEAFLQLQIRQSERTTAEEVRLTQMELEQSLGGIFSLLTVEFLIPYLNRVMHILERMGDIPKIPKEYVRPSIVAGVNALGRGQDRESLTAFIGTIAQAMGPEALAQYIEPLEAIKRLAAAQGIEILNLVKTPQQVQGERQQGMEAQQQMELTKQAGQFESAPINDPSKNPALADELNDATEQGNPTATGATEEAATGG